MSYNPEQNINEKDQSATTQNLQIQPLMGEMRRTMKAKLEHTHECLDQVENTCAGQPQPVPQSHMRDRAPVRREIDDYYKDGYDEKEDSVGSYRRNGQGGRVRNRDDGLSGIKMKIPSFESKFDPEAYLEWEKKIEFIFDCHSYSEAKKVKLVVIELSDYVITWWDQLVISSQSVEHYHKEMEIAMIRANVEEDREVTMAQFLNGLNRETVNMVNLQHYVELKRWSTRPTRLSSSLRGPCSPKLKFHSLEAKLCEARQETTSIYCTGHITSECVNKRAMVLQDNGEIVTEDEIEENEMPLLEDVEDEEYTTPGELTIVARTTLSVQVKKEEAVQRENIFYTRCYVHDKEYEDVFPKQAPHDLPPI
ncbi:hypothetical protein KPL70_023405 [Citrus sinensis]|nr:hypothetical protein KPL70_023405 [Citrus sinensis]